MSKATYDVIVSRDGKFWYLGVPALDGGTQARNLAEVEEMVRDYIAIMTEQPEDSFDINVKIELPEEASAHWVNSSKLRADALATQSKAAEEARAAARALKDDGLTVREIGKVLGMSHQRAQQLVKA